MFLFVEVIFDFTAYLLNTMLAHERTNQGSIKGKEIGIRRLIGF